MEDMPQREGEEGERPWGEAEVSVGDWVLCSTAVAAVDDNDNDNDNDDWFVDIGSGCGWGSFFFFCLFWGIAKSVVFGAAGGDANVVLPCLPLAEDDVLSLSKFCLVFLCVDEEMFEGGVVGGVATFALAGDESADE